MVTVMMAARALGADRASVLRYATSGDVGEQDRSRVVGYLSAAFWEAA
jgi:AmmeMemoRadiSam system protein B